MNVKTITSKCPDYCPLLLVRNFIDEHTRLRWMVNPPSEQPAPRKFSLDGGETSVRLYTSMQAVPMVWDQLVAEENLFLQRAYLTALEKYPPKGMRFCYFVFYKKSQAVGVSIGQVLSFQASESLNFSTISKTSFWAKAMHQLKFWLAQHIRFTALNIGNLLLTGEHGFHFVDAIPLTQQFRLLRQAADYAKTALNEQNWGINALSFKDFFDANRMPKPDQAHYLECRIEPNMVMPLRPDWQDFEDYLETLHSKYRVRARRAFKKAKAIEKQRLTTEDVHVFRTDLHRLYGQVAQQADFNLFQLHQNYLPSLQQALAENFELTAYFLEDELIGFFTTIQNGDTLEAHFLGFDQALNRSHQLYLNMLFDMVEIGIEKGAQQIVFARTATTIKSSVGAQAREMYCYFQHQNAWINALLPFALFWLQPDTKRALRHPLK